MAKISLTVQEFQALVIAVDAAVRFGEGGPYIKLDGMLDKALMRSGNAARKKLIPMENRVVLERASMRLTGKPGAAARRKIELEY